MKPRNLHKIAALFAVVVLSACGGDDNSQPANPPSGSNPPVVASNTAPVAKAGADQNVLTGATVTLDGTASSDADGDALTYSWALTSKPNGSSASLSSGNVVRPTFVADMAGIYTASLTVNDGKANSNSASIKITATKANAAPVAHAGANQEAVTGLSVALDGSASSDANGDQLTYTWTLTSAPEGSRVVLQNANTSRPSFIPDVAGQYVAGLIVYDGQVYSAPVTVTVTATRANAAPIANAGRDQIVQLQTSVTLDGSASKDPNSDPLSYRWTLTSRPGGSTAALTSGTAVHPTFVADKEGDYVVSLVVNDGTVDSEPVNVTITVLSPGLYLYSPERSGDIPLSLPFSGSAKLASMACINSSCQGAFAAYKLVASGKNFTITNLVADNLTAGALGRPQFRGLVDGQVIQSGQSVGFELISSFIRGSTLNLRYSFTIKETGETFNVSVNGPTSF